MFAFAPGPLDGGARPRPFVKWVGGKRQLSDAILQEAPARFARYHEPFLGGGAVFFELAAGRLSGGAGVEGHSAFLSDANERLIRSYRGVRDAPDAVIALLRTYPYERDFFMEFRGVAIDARSDAEVAAWFIYLNRAGFNGLYRVNSKNRFNVPFGRYTNPKLCDAENLNAVSRALRGVSLEVCSFELAAERAEAGDFVYFDPPYVPLSVTSAFTSYTADGFDMEAQRRLRDLALALKARGVFVLLSNSGAPAVRELYSDFRCVEVSATRAVNSKASARGPVTELLIS